MAEVAGLYVGLVASIGTLIQLSGIVVEYLRNTAGAPEQKRKLLNEIVSTTAILDDLQLKAQSPEWSNILDLLQQPKGPLELFKSALQTLENKAKPSNNRFMKVTKRFIFHFEKGEYEEILAKIERSKSNFMIVLGFNSNEDLMTKLKNLESKLAELHIGQNGLSQSVQRQDEEERRKILDWLSPLNFWAKQRDTLDEAEPGTGIWLLNSQEFESWTGGDVRTLWCPGNPGVGKTILSSIVFEHLRKTFDDVDDVAIACVYFNYREPATPPEILANLLKQVLERNNILSQDIRASYASHRQRNTRPHLTELSTLLTTECSRLTSCFLVLDALDECATGNNVGFKILSELQKIPNSRLMITGRPHVEMLLSKFKSTTLEIRARDEDIRRSLDTQVDESYNLLDCVRNDETFRKSVIDTITTKAKGMFLLARLHLKLLEVQPTRKRLIAALNRLPEDLDDTYSNTIERIQSQNREYANIAMRALKWITFAKRYLSTIELQHALAVEPDSEDVGKDDLIDPRKLLSICAGLLIMNSNSQIRLVHYTTQKYLHGRLKSDGDAEIAMTCLRYFTFPPFSVTSPESWWFHSYSDSYQLGSYVAKHWFEHVQGPSETDFNSTILRTFRNQGTRDLVFEMMEDLGLYETTGISIFLLASMCGLRDLCEKLLNGTLDGDCLKYVFHFWPALTHGRLTPLTLEQTDAVYKMTPLIWASRNGHLEVARLLLDRGAQIHSAQSSHNSPLYAAVSNRDVEMVRLLLDKGALNVDERRPQETLFERRQRQTILFPAYGPWGEEIPLDKRGVEIFSMLLEKGADVNSRNIGDENTPLHIATNTGQVEIMKMLLQRGANFEVKDGRGRSPLRIGIERSRVEAVRVLLDKGANPNAADKDEWSLLQSAVPFWKH